MDEVKALILELAYSGLNTREDQYSLPESVPAEHTQPSVPYRYEFQRPPECRSTF